MAISHSPPTPPLLIPIFLHLLHLLLVGSPSAHHSTQQINCRVKVRLAKPGDGSRVSGTNSKRKMKGKQMSNSSLCDQSCRVSTLAIDLRDLVLELYHYTVGAERACLDLKMIACAKVWTSTFFFFLKQTVQHLNLTILNEVKLVTHTTATLTHFLCNTVFCFVCIEGLKRLIWWSCYAVAVQKKSTFQNLLGMRMASAATLVCFSELSGRPETSKDFSQEHFFKVCSGKFLTKLKFMLSCRFLF